MGAGTVNRQKQNHLRDEAIIQARTAGTKTYAALGAEFGICRERVRQIWMRHLRKIGDERGYFGPKLWARLQKLKGEK